MSHSNSTDGETHTRRWQAADLMKACQEAYAQEQVEQLDTHLTALYRLIYQDIERQSAYWLSRFSNLNTTGERTWKCAVQDLTSIIFADMIEDLLKVELDPTRNAYGLLMTMAHHALYDLNQRTQDRRQKPAMEPLQPGDQEASMAPTQTHAVQALHYDDDGALLDVLDQESEFTDRVLERERLRECWPIVQNVLRSVEEVDRQIFALRVEHDPPVPFKQIAQEFGPGWTEAAVKQRFYRIMLLLKKQLRDLYE